MPLFSKKSPIQLRFATLTVESDCDFRDKKIVANYLVSIDTEISTSIDLIFSGSVELFDTNSSPEPQLLSGSFSLDINVLIGGFGDIKSGGASGTIRGGGLALGKLDLKGTSTLLPGAKEVNCDC